MDPAAGAAFAADGATAAAGGFNAAWLGARATRETSRDRAFAAATLALLNAGIVVQAIFAQALYTAHRFGLSGQALFATPSWIASRAALLAGTLLLSLLILRRSAR